MGAILSRLAGRRRSRSGAAGLAWGLGLLLGLIAISVFAPLFAHEGQDAIHLEVRGLAPSWHHLFGTDDLGRDTLLRVLVGGRVSLAVALLSTLVSLVVGIGLGLVAGYRGGRIDGLVSHSTDVVLSLPMFFVLLVLGSYWGAGFATLCLVIGLTNWMPVARLVRAATQSLRDRAFVEAGRALGFTTWRILMRHVLPNAAAPILVAAALAASQAILVEAALGFLGLGLRPPTPSWGVMLRDAQEHVFDAPWVAVFPGGMLCLTTLALQAVADGIRDRLDPRRRQA